jgi:hypothetical protein
MQGWLSLKIFLIILGVVFVGGIVQVWANPTTGKTTPSTTKGPVIESSSEVNSPPGTNLEAQTPKQQEELLEKEISAQERVLAAEKDELNHLSDLAKLLMTVAGVFAILLGAASWKTLDDQRKAGNENLALQKENQKLQFAGLLEESKRSLKAVSDLKDELQREFPMFGRMQNNFSNILHGLQSACTP